MYTMSLYRSGFQLGGLFVFRQPVSWTACLLLHCTTCHRQSWQLGKEMFCQSVVHHKAIRSSMLLFPSLRLFDRSSPTLVTSAVTRVRGKTIIYNSNCVISFFSVTFATLMRTGKCWWRPPCDGNDRLGSSYNYDSTSIRRSFDARDGLFVKGR